jgi:hypothetical protein
MRSEYKQIPTTNLPLLLWVTETETQSRVWVCTKNAELKSSIRQTQLNSGWGGGNKVAQRISIHLKIWTMTRLREVWTPIYPEPTVKFTWLSAALYRNQSDHNLNLSQKNHYLIWLLQFKETAVQQVLLQFRVRIKRLKSSKYLYLHAQTRNATLCQSQSVIKDKKSSSRGGKSNL